MNTLNRLFIMLACAASVAMAVDFDIYLGAGFGFPLASGTAFSSDEVNNGTTYETDDKYLNLGKGLKLDLGAQIGNIEKVMFRFAFATSFLTGGTIDEDINVLGNMRITTVNDYSAQIIGARALVVPHFSLTDMLSMYCGMGAGLFYAFSESEIQTTTVSTIQTMRSSEYDNRAFPGLLSVLGVRMNISGPFSAIAQVGYDAMNITVEKETHTAANGNVTTINYERDATDRPAPPKIPATNFSLKAAFVFSIK
jgi:hypothetical protein